jgi:signal transduction histidine kinase
MVEIEKDASLLRCTWKKSISVLQKVVLYASYVITGLAGVAVAGFIAWKGFEVIVPVLLAIVAILVMIPWYYYAGVIALGSIPAYSLLWCMARDLKDEDWQSETAKTIAAAFAFAAVFAAFAVFAAAFAAFAFAAAFAAVFAAVFAIAAADNSKAFLLVGAYLHYRKRIRESKKDLGSKE